MRRIPQLLVGLLAVLFSACIFADEPITVKTDLSKVVQAWPLPATTTIRKELADWMDAAKLGSDDQRKEILSRWMETDEKISGEVMFLRTVDSMRAAAPAIAAYLDACDQLAWKELPFGQKAELPTIPLQALVGEEGSTAYLTGSMRFYLAQRLVQARLYDEAQTMLDHLTAENSVDPTGVLITKAVVANQLGDHENGVQAIKTFKKSVDSDPLLPRRYTELAKLLEADLNNSKKDEDPAKISRKMDDVRRRLGKGRTDDGTQEAEDGVMKSLDKLIEKIEEKMKQMGDSDGDQGQNANNPAKDSRILKQKGPGNVDRKEFDAKGGWGDLPPKEREETLLRIEKEFPAHYRDIIEQYFREMAK